MEVYLETSRLRLRRFTEADVDNLTALDSDPEVMRYLTDGKPTDRETIRTTILPRFLKSYETHENYGYWAVEEKSSGEFLGWFHLRPFAGSAEEIEIGYRFRRAAWGKGYATEGARALAKKGFVELGAKRIVAVTMAANTGSRRVMEKTGLKFEKDYIEERFPGANKHGVKYSLAREDFKTDD
jgi:RimJ/RimL family protein N-acetyltransferase